MTMHKKSEIGRYIYLLVAQLAKPTRAEEPFARAADRPARVSSSSDSLELQPLSPGASLLLFEVLCSATLLRFSGIDYAHILMRSALEQDANASKLW